MMETELANKLANNIGMVQLVCHDMAKTSGWWAATDMQDVQMIPTKLCLIHSEISEAMEADRKDLYDNHLPHRLGLEVELADALIRILDLAGALGLNIGGAVAEKLEYNAYRADHKPENRSKVGGKKY